MFIKAFCVSFNFIQAIKNLFEAAFTCSGHVCEWFGSAERWRSCDSTLSIQRERRITPGSGSGSSESGSAKMEAAVFILSLVDCCALIFLSVYFVSFINASHEWRCVSLIASQQGFVVLMLFMLAGAARCRLWLRVKGLFVIYDDLSL